MIHDFFNDVVDHVVDALHHAREYKARLDHVLIGIDANHKMRGASVLFSLLLNRVESAEARVAGRGEDHVCTFTNLGQRQFFAFARIVPRAVSHADVVSDHADVRINRLRAFLVTLRETMDQADVHTAEKTDGARVRRFDGEYADEIRTLMFFEHERRDVWQLTNTVD